MTPESAPVVDVQQILAALSQTDVLALTIWGEARNQAVEGRIAVGCVIRNRLIAGRWGHDYKAVCLAPWQFSCWTPKGGPANYETVLAAARALLHPEGHRGPDLRECLWIAEGLTSGALRDRVAGCAHYVTRELWHSQPPSWARGMDPAIRIGDHVFFRGVA
jgi:hypothetical protein